MNKNTNQDNSCGIFKPQTEKEYIGFSLSNKKIALVILLMASISMMAVSVSAVQTQRLCIGQDQVIQFSKCNPSMSDFKCGSDMCDICVAKMDSGAYCPRSPNACNSLGLICEGTSGNTTLDMEPPVLTVNSPNNGAMYRDKSVLVDLITNEPATFYYKDASETRWAKLSGKPTSLKQFIKLKDGENKITFRAVDRSKNIAEANKTFFVDSKAPEITSTEPKRGNYASGIFKVEFREENPKTLALKIGNLSGLTIYSVNLNSCIEEKTKKVCEINVNLDSYNRQQINYWFTIEDIVGNVKDSRPISVKVDNVKPMFNKLNYTILGKRVNLDILLSEKADLEYMDNLEKRPMWKTLCRNCNKYKGAKTFTVGVHDVAIRATDDAGNFNSQTITLPI